MSKLTDLKKYIISNEYITLSEKYKNKIDKIREIIILSYKENNIDRTAKYSEKDVLFLRYWIYYEVFSNIKDVNDWLKYFRDTLSKRIEEMLDIIVFTLENNNWTVKSTPKYTDLDLETIKIATYNDCIVNELNWIINSLTTVKNNINYDIY